MDVPAEIQIKATIKSGCVYYFVEESFTGTKPHYFVVLNNKPLEDGVVILVCAVTLDISVIERAQRLGQAKETLIDVTPQDCALFAHPTLFNCNSVFVRSIDDLVTKLKDHKLRMHNPVDVDLLRKLREGVLASKEVTKKVKKLLR